MQRRERNIEVYFKDEEEISKRIANDKQITKYLTRTTNQQVHNKITERGKNILQGHYKITEKKNYIPAMRNEQPRYRYQIYNNKTLPYDRRK